MARRALAVADADVRAPLVSGRMCVGCRGRAERADLLRVVAVEGQLVPDPARRLPGRGANLHLEPDCFELAVRRRAWSRAFRDTGPLDVAKLRAHVEQGRPPQRPAHPDEEQVEHVMSAR